MEKQASAKASSGKPWIAAAAVALALACLGLFGWTALFGFEPGLRKHEVRRVALNDDRMFNARIALLDGGKRALRAYALTIDLWDLEKGGIAQSLSRGSYPQSFAFWTVTPDGKTLAFQAGIADPLEIWDIATWSKTASIKIARPPREMKMGYIQGAFSPDGSKIAISSFEGEIAVFDTASGEKTLSIEALLPADTDLGRLDAASSLAFSLDGKTILCALEKEGAGAWDASTGEQLLEGKLGLEKCYQALALAGGKALFAGDVAGGSKTDFVVWDIAKNAEAFRFQALEEFRPFATADAQGRRVAFMDREGAGNEFLIRVWDIEKGEEIASWRCGAFKPSHRLYFHAVSPYVERVPGLRNSPCEPSMSPDGRYLLSQEATYYSSKALGARGEGHPAMRVWELP